MKTDSQPRSLAFRRIRNYLLIKMPKTARLALITLAFAFFPVTGQTDSIAVRAILDSSGLTTTRVADVATFTGTRVTKLDFSTMGLKTLPPEIGRLSFLRDLNLYNNLIDHLPPEIGDLDSLYSLGVAWNRLTSLPPELSGCLKIEVLDLTGNRFSVLPSVVGSLTHLVLLRCQINRLTALPPEIGALKNLQDIELYQNALTALPPQIGQCTRLVHILAWDNDITYVPPEIGGLRSLQELEISNNLITSLPPEIGDLDSVHRVNCGSNRLTAIPPEFFNLPLLNRLEFSGNLLSGIPGEVTKRTFPAGRVDFGNNRLCTLPDSVANWLNAYDPDWNVSQNCGAGRTIYVDKNAGGGDNGASWTDAFTSLTGALAIAGFGDEIWVAEGTYTPAAATDRSVCFILKNGVSLYGGFAGSESLLEERDWVAHKTVLSGDLNGDDSAFTHMEENPYHILRPGDGTIISGFQISGGNGNEHWTNGVENVDYENLYGAGILASGCSTVVANCVLTANKSCFEDKHGDPSPPSGTGGAIACISGARIQVENTLFYDNKAMDGGAINLFRSRASIINCTFVANHADTGGALFVDLDCSAKLKNNLFWNNTAAMRARDIFNNAQGDKLGGRTYWLTAWNNLIAGGLTGAGVSSVFPDGLADSGGTINADPLFADLAALAGPDGLLGTADDGAALLQNSPCIDAGVSSDAPAFDILGNPRPQGSAPDIGAYESPFQGMSADKAPRSKSMAFSCYPNPFNPVVALKCDLRRAAEIDVAVFSIQGKRMVTLHHGVLAAGQHILKWNGADNQAVKSASGVYFMQVIADKTRIFTSKIVFAR